VTTPSGTSSTGSADQFTYTAAAAPSVTSVTPNSGSALGSSLVTVLGTGFTAATAVKFGTTAATSFTILSDGAILVVVPAGSVGTVDITVTTPSGSSSTGSADQYTYTTAPSAPSVTSVSPSTGSGSGGTVVTVTGTGFTGATAVNFGATPASAFFVNSDTTLTVVAPAAAAGTVDITVTTPSGTSSTGSADQYIYSSTSAPSVTGVSLSSDPVNQTANVTISGSGFTGATAVNFGATSAVSFTVMSDGTIFAVAPAESAGTVDVTVTTPAGTSSTGSADQFTYATDAALAGLVPPVSVNTVSGVAYSGSVAGFVDTDTGGTASQFTANIDWGNGQFSAGTIVGDGMNGMLQPQFLVNGGGGVYSAAGTYTITVYIYDVGGSTFTVTTTATVTSPPGAPGRSGPLAKGTKATATHGVAFNGSVASFAGSILGGTAASYTATINWGDGTSTSGVIRATGANTFSVIGSKTYAAAGTYTVSITITDSSGASTTVTTTITVAQADVQDSTDDDSPPPVVAALAVKDDDEEDDATGDGEQPNAGPSDEGAVPDEPTSVWLETVTPTDWAEAADAIADGPAGLGWQDVSDALTAVVDELFATLSC
jgi:hypothetical protein